MGKLVTDGISEGRLKMAPVDYAFVERTQAAGFRQRREGLAYRLTWPQAGMQPRKRVQPDSHSLTLRRKLIYRMRANISTWSHCMFWLARRFHQPALYTKWARTAAAVYHALAYSRGQLGKLMEKIGLR